MYPKQHVILGIILSLLLLLLTNFNLYQVSIIFLASVLIDVDHYIYYIFRFKSLSLKKAYIWFRKRAKLQPKKRAECLVAFHTFEFLLLISILAIYFQTMFLILIGFLIHSFIDLFDMSSKVDLESREYFLTKYLLNHYSK